MWICWKKMWICLYWWHKMWICWEKMWICLYISTSFFNISVSLGLVVKSLSRLKRKYQKCRTQSYNSKHHQRNCFSIYFELNNEGCNLQTIRQYLPTDQLIITHHWPNSGPEWTWSQSCSSHHGREDLCSVDIVDCQRADGGYATWGWHYVEEGQLIQKIYLKYWEPLEAIHKDIVPQEQSR